MLLNHFFPNVVEDGLCEGVTKRPHLKAKLGGGMASPGEPSGPSLGAPMVLLLPGVSPGQLETEGSWDLLGPDTGVGTGWAHTTSASSPALLDAQLSRNEVC